MGLDYTWDKSPKEIQHEVFEKQIRLAKKVKLPIIIHNRELNIVRILKEEGCGSWWDYALFQRKCRSCRMYGDELLYFARGASGV